MDFPPILRDVIIIICLGAAPTVIMAFWKMASWRKGLECDISDLRAKVEENTEQIKEMNGANNADHDEMRKQLMHEIQQSQKHASDERGAIHDRLNEIGTQVANIAGQLKAGGMVA